MSSDLIRKQLLLPVPRRVAWQAIGNADQFGTWFGATFDGPFVVGARLCGRIVPTQVDPEVAKLQEPHVGKPFEIVVETVEPPARFAFSWHPFAIDPNHDYSQEPMTRVTFDLAEIEVGCVLTIVESGFDQLPVERRLPAFQANRGGWSHQARLIAKYLSR